MLGVPIIEGRGKGLHFFFIPCNSDLFLGGKEGVLTSSLQLPFLLSEGKRERQALPSSPSGSSPPPYIGREKGCRRKGEGRFPSFGSSRKSRGGRGRKAARTRSIIQNETRLLLFGDGGREKRKKWDVGRYRVLVLPFLSGEGEKERRGERGEVC